MCQTLEAPDGETLATLLEEAVAAHGEQESLSYFDEGRTLLVNNYTSLALCHQTL